METKKLLNYTLDFVDITEFKTYLNDNEDYFSTNAKNAYLKALDIPPKFFKEQPKETQIELLDNREIFVRENKKFFDKVIVVVKFEKDLGQQTSIRILGASRLDKAIALKTFEQLNSIGQVSNKFEHRSFIKDGYISLIISNGIDRKDENRVLALDFPINLNKKPILHEAVYKLPDETFATSIEHIHYLNSKEVELGVDYNDIKEAIDDNSSFLEEEKEDKEVTPILREVELVTLALQELGTIPKSYRDKLTSYISDNLKGELDNVKLESLVLDFDETFNSYKQVTALRSVSGDAVLEFLDSPQFKELNELMEDIDC